MNLARSTCVFLLAVASSILFLSEGKKSCESALLQTCISRYRELIKKELASVNPLDPSDDKHCTRVQEVVSCIAENPSCKGKSVNRFRLWVVKEAMLEVKLNICPKVNVNKLKDSVANTAEAKEHGVEETDVNEDLSCARDVHIACSKQFLELMMKNKHICDDAVAWFDCYKNNNCNSKTIERYAKFVEKVGKQLSADARLANSCKDEL